MPTALTARSTASGVRPLTTTFAPAAASPLAVARPMPAVEPVMMAVFPERSISCQLPEVRPVNVYTRAAGRAGSRSLCYDDFGVRLPPPCKLPYGNAGMRSCWIGTIVTLNLCASAISADPALRRTGAPWPDTLLARVEALALIETLNARLLCASCTATEVLDQMVRRSQTGE